MEKYSELVIYTDGGARGNPGPAAVGVVINGKGYREYVGQTTNNIAEYKAVIYALQKAKELLGGKSKEAELNIFLDSELLYYQFAGMYRVKHKNLKPLYLEVKELILNFKKVSFNLVPREKNTAADALVNEELDSNKS